MRRWRFVTLWLVLTVVATAVGLLAVSVVGEQLRTGTFRDLLEAGERVDEELEEVTSTVQRLDLLGGTVQAQCTGGRAQVVTVGPAPGWRLEDREDGDAGAVVRLRDATRRHTAELRCDGGQVRVSSVVTVLDRPTPTPTTSPSTASPTAGPSPSPATTTATRSAGPTTGSSGSSGSSGSTGSSGSGGAAGDSEEDGEDPGGGGSEEDGGEGSGAPPAGSGSGAGGGTGSGGEEDSGGEDDGEDGGAGEEDSGGEDGSEDDGEDDGEEDGD